MPENSLALPSENSMHTVTKHLQLCFGYISQRDMCKGIPCSVICGGKLCIHHWKSDRQHVLNARPGVQYTDEVAA